MMTEFSVNERTQCYGSFTLSECERENDIATRCFVRTYSLLFTLSVGMNQEKFSHSLFISVRGCSHNAMAGAKVEKI